MKPNLEQLEKLKERLSYLGSPSDSVMTGNWNTLVGSGADLATLTQFVDDVELKYSLADAVNTDVRTVTLLSNVMRGGNVQIRQGIRNPVSMQLSQHLYHQCEEGNLNGTTWLYLPSIARRRSMKNVRVKVRIVRDRIVDIKNV